MKFRPRSNFNFFEKGFALSLASHLTICWQTSNKKPPPHPREPPKPFKKTFPGTTHQNHKANLPIVDALFGHISGVATSQPSGSNPDRSPAAQWLNMRISPASCRLLAPSSQLPASRGPVKTLSGPGRPGVGGKPARRGRFSEINTVAGWLQGSSQNA